MRWLSGLDASGLYQESAEVPFHTLKLLVLSHDWTADALRARLREREPRLDPLRWRLARPPLAISHPWWRLGPLPDLDHHVQELALEGGSDLRVVCELVSSLNEPLLERDHPLWRMWVIRGLPEARAMVVVKLHHSIADGAASRELLERIFGPERSALQSAEPDSEPSGNWQDVVLMLRGAHRTMVALPSLFGGTLHQLRHQRTLTQAGLPRPRTAFSGATPPWGMDVTRSRAIAVAELPADSLRRVRERYGASTTDVLIALLGGTLRPSLPPGTELTAVVPVNTRRGTDDEWGNHSSFSFRTLASDCEDPETRIAATATEGRVARKRRTVDGSRTVETWWEAYPLCRAVRVLAEVTMRFVRGRVTAAAIVSTVAGPPSFDAGDAQVEQLYSIGPLANGILLNVTAWSYKDVLSIGVIVCPSDGLDPWRIAEAIQSQLSVLDR